MMNPIKKEYIIVRIFMGTNLEYKDMILNREFNDISWWSDNFETVAHYYEGAVVEITVKLYPEQRQDYIRYIEDNQDVSNYTYGFAEMRCPAGAIWYSFSRKYLEENVIDVQEIFPDLSDYNND